ncbi:hyaluronidase [Streptococcus phage Javan290]|uniref:gp58-like family protein n=1 Tax=Streptococcus marmotae TaxID=1825069 RepID=UPI00082E54A8|nr:gp58-like family protein [Streptococcus marmotae]QBX16934.1 hypothetical protein Javan291_0058 [Streptococcus phage Javan291]QBX26065.1 hyaluronidase [Streptococcus phage Javan290]
MDITIQQTRSKALEKDGRYYKVFTPRSPDEVVKLHHMGCVGDTVARNIQIEKGTSPSSFASPVTTSRALTGLFKDMRDINIELTDQNSPLWGRIRANNRGMLSEFLDRDVRSALAQTSSSILAQVEAKDQGNIKRSELILDNNGFVTKVGKTINGTTLATMIAQNERDVSIIAQKFKVTGDMLVDGAITARKLDTNSVRTGILTAGSITADMIQSGAITGDKLKVDTALINKLATNSALIDNLVAKDAFITKLQSVDLDASRIKSGVLKSKNGSVTWNLDANRLDFYTGAGIEFHDWDNYIKFHSGGSVAFIQPTVRQGTNRAALAIGVNGNNSIDSNTGAFAGIKIFKDNLWDNVSIYGDTIQLTSGFNENHALFIDVVKFNGGFNLGDILQTFNENFKSLSNGKPGDVLTWNKIYG